MILVGMGSNLSTEHLPTSQAVLEEAIRLLATENINVIKLSRFYETEPIPKSDQPWYVNAVAQVESDLSAEILLDRLHKVEERLGRIRQKRWEARIIDLDLLCYHNEIFPSETIWQEEARKTYTDKLVVPHARMHQRLFVLLPLAEIASDWKHPIFDKNVSSLIEEQKSTGIVRVL